MAAAAEASQQGETGWIVHPMVIEPVLARMIWAVGMILPTQDLVVNAVKTVHPGV